MADAGRPSFEWTEAIEDEILDKIMEGELPKEFLAEGRPDHFPGLSTFFKRLRDDEGFSKRYARAKEFQADLEMDEVRSIADDGSNDWMEVNDPDNPGWRVNGENVQRSKLRVDARKFRAVKLAPKKYGDRVNMEHEGNVGVTVNVNRLPRGN